MIVCDVLPVAMLSLQLNPLQVEDLDMLARLKLAREKEEDCMESLVDLGEADEEAAEDDEDDDSLDVSSRLVNRVFKSPQLATLVSGDSVHSTHFRVEVPPPLRQRELTEPRYGIPGPAGGSRSPD